MRGLNLCAATLFGLLTLFATIVSVVTEGPRTDEPPFIVEAICAALFFYFLHAWRQGRKRRLRQIRAAR